MTKKKETSPMKDPKDLTKVIRMILGNPDGHPYWHHHPDVKYSYIDEDEPGQIIDEANQAARNLEAFKSTFMNERTTGGCLIVTIDEKGNTLARVILLGSMPMMVATSNSLTAIISCLKYVHFECGDSWGDKDNTEFRLYFSMK